MSISRSAVSRSAPSTGAIRVGLGTADTGTTTDAELFVRGSVVDGSMVDCGPALERVRAAPRGAGLAVALGAIDTCSCLRGVKTFDVSVRTDAVAGTADGAARLRATLSELCFDMLDAPSV